MYCIDIIWFPLRFFVTQILGQQLSTCCLNDLGAKMQNKHMLLPHSNMDTPKFMNTPKEKQLLNLGKGNVHRARLCEAVSVDIGIEPGCRFPQVFAVWHCYSGYAVWKLFT